MNEQFPAAKISERIRVLPPSVHNKELEMESRHGRPGKQTRMTTTLVGLIEPIKQLGSMDTDIDDLEVMPARQCLVLKVQKMSACCERYTKQHQKVTEDDHNQTEDKQQFLTYILPLLPVPLVVSNLQQKKRNKLVLEQLALGDLTL